MTSQQEYTAVIAGATGLIGEELVKLLLEDKNCKAVLALSRRELPYRDKRLIQCLDPKLELDTQHLPTLAQAPMYGFIALGTTLKQAGSKEALADVDLHLVTKVAQQLKTVGVERLAVVSSIGASSTSLGHYLKCKGQMEDNLSALNFEHLSIFRPGPLEGLREEQRTNELITSAVLKVIQPIMKGKLRNYRLIHGKTVAQSMQIAIQSDKKAQVLFSRDMERLVR
ncbi:NAD(P)H-binding protein [Vibrio agarivorans]|uniref:NAD(P)H-binding protein n=1 Tax=Vibrio agarivorans TaxID=153622 RepID=UPI0025B446FD|nr:NAD(P)H-binding protein [Vibrio agarivorans]MDN3663259.1 NAD(P)H-binding protein [Vibrio agarivorans]